MTEVYAQNKAKRTKIGLSHITQIVIKYKFFADQLMRSRIHGSSMQRIRWPAAAPTADNSDYPFAKYAKQDDDDEITDE